LREQSAEHLDGGGQQFFELVCEQDLEGIVRKPKTSPYPFTWIKVKKSQLLTG
jgi:ATP-dependent DNA ligase